MLAQRRHRVSLTPDKRALRIPLALGVLIWIALAVPAAAVPAPIFGPEDFVRSTEEPQTESRTFSTAGSQGPFLLRLENGGADGTFGRVSSALVTLNGEVVFGPRDFNQTVGLLEREVVLEPDNELTVEVRSIPGTGFTLTVLGEPAGPTQVEILEPESGLVTSAGSVRVSGVLSGRVESIGVNGVPAVLDGGSFAAGVPLEEGTNRLVATATDGEGVSATDAVSVRRDTTPPLVVIETPRDGDRLVGETVTVAGTVNDIIPGATVNEDDVTVTVNGQPAPVMNRTFLVADLPLELGDNTLTAVAVDRVGNTGTSSIVVSREPDLAGIRIVITRGNNQRGLIGSLLPEPLSVRVVGEDGQPIAGRPLTFTVSRGDGLLGDPADGLRSQTLLSAADGTAVTSFQLGSRTGEGFHRVRVTTPGSLTFAELCATAEPAPPATISITRAPPTRGMVDRPLIEPLSVIVNDSGGNGVPGVPVTFRVELGGGSFSGQDSVEILTDPDGIAEAEWTLGPEPGTANNEASATFPDNPGLPAVFTASGFATGPPEETTVEGVVQNSAGEPIVGARAVLRGTDLEAFTGPDGRFVIEDVPPGGHHVGILGGPADEPERGRFYPDIEFAIEAIAGVANELDQVVVLPFLDLAGAKLVGGDEDVILEMEGVPGFAIKVFAHSVILPDGSRGEVLMSSSQVKFDKVPMPPPQGSTPLVVGTLQPAGIRFDPPAQVTYPNVEGLAPGDVADIFTFHHDIGQFVNAGPGTVTEDGSVVVSDPGFGIVQSGWHCLIRIPGPAADCANKCSGRIEWRISANGEGGGSSGPVKLGAAEEAADAQQVTVTVSFRPGGGSNDSSPVWKVADSGVAEIVGSPTSGDTVTLRGVKGGTTTLTSAVYRIPQPSDQGDKTCQAEVDVTVVGVKIEEADVTMDRIRVKLEPAGLSGELKLELIEPDTHVIRTDMRDSGTRNESFEIPNLAIGEYMKVKATWKVMGATATDELEHHIRVLGNYRHSQYNTPHEAQCSGPDRRAYITDSRCSFNRTTLRDQFISQVNLNGSGVSINFGDLQGEVFCLGQSSAPGDAANRSFRQQTIRPDCAGFGLGNDTVARDPAHPHLDCGDEVFIHNVGVKTVTDRCPACGDPTNRNAGEVGQLDNFTLDGACSSNEVGDLARNRMTIKIFPTDSETP